MDKISIIVVCYNENVNDVSYTLESIINQDYQNKEIIIVDGKSHKAALFFLRTYESGIVKVYSEPDEGIYDAMNKGVELSTGEWIIFINIRDRFVSSSVLTEAMRIIAGFSVKPDMVYGHVINQYGRKVGIHSLSRNLLFDRMICHQAILASRDAFKKIGGFDLSYKLLADRDWVVRAIDYKLDIKQIPLLFCEWEEGGACADYETVRAEEIRFRILNFPKVKNGLLTLAMILRKIFNRIKTVNFKIPVRLSGIINRK